MASKAVGIIVLTILRAVSWCYYFKPFFAKKIFGQSIGALCSLFRMRSNVIAQNLAIAFPDDAEKRKILHREAYNHLGHLVFEIMMLLGPMKRYAQKHGVVKGIEHWYEARKSGKGVLFLSSHVGNWEIMAASGAQVGIDIMLVTKRLKPDWLHQAIEKGRADCGVLATYEPRTFRDVLTHLKKNGTVGFVLDQYAGPPVGVRVPVFGVPVGTNTVVAMIAKRTGATVLTAVNYRTDEGTVVVEIGPGIDWIEHHDPNYEIAQNTAHYAEILQKHVYAHPEQWLWIHKRFKGDLSPIRPEEWEDGRARR